MLVLFLLIGTETDNQRPLLLLTLLRLLFNGGLQGYFGLARVNFSELRLPDSSPLEGEADCRWLRRLEKLADGGDEVVRVMILAHKILI